MFSSSKRKTLIASGKIEDLKTGISVGEVTGEISVEGLRFRYSPEAFVQTHPDQSHAIYTKIVEHLKAVYQKELQVLDLYGGIGITAALVAKEKGKVVSVELNKNGSTLARENFKLNQLTGGDFFCGTVESYLKNKSLDLFHLIIANPPEMEFQRRQLKCWEHQKNLFY